MKKVLMAALLAASLLGSTQDSERITSGNKYVCETTGVNENVRLNVLSPLRLILNDSWVFVFNEQANAYLGIVKDDETMLLYMFSKQFQILIVGMGDYKCKPEPVISEDK